jgi:hypothetical protein
MNKSILSKVAQTVALMILATPGFTKSASAQTDYYNTDSGRPLTIEDASATERYAFELQLAPIRLERTRGGRYLWEIEPELAYGIFPRTQVEVAAPISYYDGSSGARPGLGGIVLSALHNLNVETSLPALAVSGAVVLPIGSTAPDKAVFSTKAIATRTFRWARFHVNGEYAFSDEDSPSESSRWLAGLAVDKTFPLSSMLIGAEVFAREAVTGDGNAVWNGAVGIRKQLSPSFNVDAGIGRQFTGEDRSWFVTLGLAHAFAIRSLMSGRRAQ